jgi:hypothetical protein
MANSGDKTLQDELLCLLEADEERVKHEEQRQGH